MVLPTKHLSAEKAIISLGGHLLTCLSYEMTISEHWEKTKKRQRNLSKPNLFSFETYVLTLDFLFIVGALELHNGMLRKAES